jgi:hypothetical protein
VLAVIEDEQGALPLDCANQVLHRIARGRERESERPSDGRWNVVAAGQRCEFDEPDAVGGTVKQICRDLQRCARLADACGPNECDESMPLDERHDFGDLRVASDERLQLQRKVVWE